MKNNTILLLLFISICFSCNDLNRNYLEKAECLVDTFPDSALVYLDSVNIHSLTEKNLDWFHILTVQAKDKARHNISNDTVILFMKGKYDSSDPYKGMLVYLYSGKVLEQKNDYRNALLNYLEAKNIELPANNYKGLIVSAIANLYYKQRDIEEAKDIFLEVLHEFEETKDTKNMMITYNQLGNCYLVLDRVDSAYYHYNKCRETLLLLENFENKAGILNNLSVAYQYAGEIDTARAYLHEALTYETNGAYKARIYMNLAELSNTDRDTFYQYANKALNLMETEHYDPMIMATIYEVMSTYEQKQDNFELALEYHKELIKHRTKFYELKEETELRELQKKYDLGVVERKNMELLIRQQRLIIGSLGALVLVIILIYFLSRQKQALMEAHNQIDCLREMAKMSYANERSLRSIVLYNFKILKKVALLEHQAVPASSGRQLIKRINEILYGRNDMDWNQLYETMNALHDNLFNKMKDSFPQLEDIEFKICCLSIAKFTNVEIGILLGYSVNTITSKKAILRKKMGIKPSGNIRDFLNQHFTN